jgi:hypothetical protein
MRQHIHTGGLNVKTLQQHTTRVPASKTTRPSDRGIRMPKPDLQSIVIVAAVDHPVATWALKEAAQVNWLFVMKRGEVPLTAL